VPKKFFEFCLTSNPGIPEYRDLAFCLRIPTLDGQIQTAVSILVYSASLIESEVEVVAAKGVPEQITAGQLCV
jgi:hypothetical protein